MINITSVKTQHLEEIENGKVAGIASVIIDECFIITDIRILKGKENNLYIGFPSRKQQNATWKDICHPLNAETRKVFEDAILEEFNKEGAIENANINNS